MRAPESPRYALVVFADATANAPCCISLDALPAAISRGALVLAREDDVLSEPLPAMDMTLLSNPRRCVDEAED